MSHIVLYIHVHLFIPQKVLIFIEHVLVLMNIKLIPTLIRRAG